MKVLFALNPNVNHVNIYYKTKMFATTKTRCQKADNDQVMNN